MAYLDCYKFNKNVLPLNRRGGEYFRMHGIPGGSFAWVEEELLAAGHYKQFNNAKIGIPQGGALSGLIANIVLNEADEAIAATTDKDLTYIRFCDDMIIAHKLKRQCRKYLAIYESSLDKLKLLIHPAIEVRRYGPSYWETKSKRPFKWGPSGKIEWVGFLGYEINRQGEVRVRKASVRREMTKQYEVVKEVLTAIGSRPRSSRGAILESVTNRLVQMAVGRVRLHNYQTAVSELCWANGFRLVTDNTHSRIQMRRLDACRNSLLRRLERALRRIESFPRIERRNRRQAIYYGKPFSYYFHLIEKERK